MPAEPISRTGLARALSKLGHCSRSQGTQLIKLGRVKLNGVVCRDPEKPVQLGRDQVVVDHVSVQEAKQLYILLNKPRGIVTTASDEHGRATVYSCFEGQNFTHLSPVGRLDKASEGLLLFTNDNRWANGITDPSTHVEKTYHVQIDRVPDAKLIAALRVGVALPDGTRLDVADARVLRAGERHGWLEVVLDEGRNRHLRRLLAALGVDVLRLVRVAIGALALGDLAKGAWRLLDTDEVHELDTAPEAGR